MSQGHDHEHEHDHVHIVPYGSHTLVYVGLLILTGLTVAAAGIDVGAFNLPIAMLIASCKAGLVLAYFMHIKYEKTYIQAFVLGTSFFMFVVFCLTFADYATR